MEFTGPKPLLKIGEPLRDMMRSLHASNSLDSLSFSQLHQQDWRLFSDTSPSDNSITIASLGHAPLRIVTEVLLKCHLEKLIIDGIKQGPNYKDLTEEEEELVRRKAASLNWLEFIISSNTFKIFDDSPIGRLFSCIVKALVNTTSALEITTKDPCIKAESVAKWKTVKISLPGVDRKMLISKSKQNMDYKKQIFQSVKSILKLLVWGLSSTQNVQHLICDTVFWDYPAQLKLHEYDESWMSSLKLLLVPCLTSQLRLCLSPAEWAAILCGVRGAKDLEELNVTMKLTEDNTPVDEKELCEAWSQCKCKTVKMVIESRYYIDEGTELKKSFVRTLLKGISLCQTVQHLVIDCGYNCSSEYDESWMSSLKQFLVPHLTSQLRLCLSPAEWAVILCGVGGAKDLEELNVTMWLTDDNTPVDEKELCEAWSQCKCKTVKMEIEHRDEWTELKKSFVRTLLKGISLCQNVQHLIIDCKYNCSSEYDESWMSSLKLLLVPCLTCQLTLRLSPAEWAAIFCGVGGAKDLEELNVTMRLTDGKTPVDEKELCEAWSQCKCKTVKMKIEYDDELTELKKSFVRTLLKEISLCQNVEYLMIDCEYNCSSEYDESWMSSLKLLLVPCLTCQLRLRLSPAGWAAILCGVGGAKDLEELNVTMWLTDGNTPVDEKELCKAWSRCKCKTVKMKIGYDSAQTPQGVSLLTGVLGGIAQNKTSVEFKLEFRYNSDQSYCMERISGDILTHFTRDGETLTLNPLNSRCSTGGVSSGESPQIPGSSPTGEPSNKRRHIEQSPLVGVTDCSSSVLESDSSSPVQQVDHASRNVHSTQSDSSRISPMSQRASLPQSPISSVGVTVDPSSLVTVPMETSRLDMSPNSTHSHISACHMEDSPQPLSTYPIEPQYETGQPLSLSSSATSQGIPQQMDTSPMNYFALKISTGQTPPPLQGPLPTEDLPPPTLSSPSEVHVASNPKEVSYSYVRAKDVIKSFKWSELVEGIENMLTKPRADILEREYYLVDSPCNSKIEAQLDHGDPASAASKLLKYFERNHNGDDMLRFCEFLRDEAKKAGRSAALENLADRIEKILKDQGSSRGILD